MVAVLQKFLSKKERFYIRKTDFLQKSYRKFLSQNTTEKIQKIIRGKNKEIDRILCYTENAKKGGIDR